MYLSAETLGEMKDWVFALKAAIEKANARCRRPTGELPEVKQLFPLSLLLSYMSSSSSNNSLFLSFFFAFFHSFLSFFLSLFLPPAVPKLI